MQLEEEREINIEKDVRIEQLQEIVKLKNLQIKQLQLQMVIEREKIKVAITNNFSNSIKTTAKVSLCGSQNEDILLLEN